MSISTKFNDTPQHSGIHRIDPDLYFTEPGVSEFKCPLETALQFVINTFLAYGSLNLPKSYTDIGRHRSFDC